MSRRKKIIRAVAITLLVLLVGLTFASRTIQNLTRPSVKTEIAQAGTISTRTEVNGRLYYNKIQTYKAQGNWTIDYTVVSYEQEVHTGDVLCKIDMTQFDIQRKELELAVYELERQLAQAPTDSDLVTKRLEIARMELAAFVEAVPANGELLATMDGTVVFITDEDYVTDGTLVASIVPPESRPFVEWQMTSDEAAIFDDTARVRVRFFYQEREQSSGAEIWTKTAQEDGTYRYTAQLDARNSGVNGQNAYITLSMSSPTYDYVAPESAIFMIKNTPTIFVKRERKGVFGMENYVEGYPITIIKEGDGKVAFTCSKLYYTDRLVIEADKTPTDGMLVSVIEK